MSAEVAPPDTSTPLPIIAQVSRVVTRVVDRIAGDRVDYPLLVAAACEQALKQYGIESRIMYGPAAWVEVTEDNQPFWAGCWGENFHFWVATQFGEVVDLNVSIAHRKRVHQNPQLKSAFSPPMLWSAEVPNFYRYQPEGVAEIELTDPKDQKKYDLVIREIQEKCTLEAIQGEPQFPSEAMLCPGRRVLDDGNQSFKHFDRALAVRGVPQAPF